MDTPPLKSFKQKTQKQEPIDEQLRELRGFAVEIKQPAPPGEAVRRIQDVIDGHEREFGMTGQVGKIDLLPNLPGSRGQV